METRCEIIVDLWTSDNWPLFSRSGLLNSVLPVPRIGDVEFTTLQRIGSPDRDALVAVCTDRTAAWLARNTPEDFGGLWLFVAHTYWLHGTSIVMYKKLWKSAFWQDLWPHGDDGLLSLGPEIACHSSEGVRFAGLASVSREGFATAVDLVRRIRSAAVVVSDSEMGASDVTRFFVSAFTPEKGIAQSDIDWPALCISFCPLGRTVLRMTGKFDDRDVSIDCFMLSERVVGFAQGGCEVE